MPVAVLKSSELKLFSALISVAMKAATKVARLGPELAAWQVGSRS